jgi:hypothetical protein
VEAPERPAYRRILIWLGLLLIAVAALHGILPFSPVEGDDQGVLNGLAEWPRDTDSFVAHSYLYAIQPGSYLLLHGLSQVLGLPALVAFGGLTIIGGLLFAVLAARLLADLTQWPFLGLLAMLLTFQECTAALRYANTSAFANALALAGVWLAWRAAEGRRLLLAGLCLAIAGWLRADALLIAPAVLPLRALKRGWSAAWRETLSVAATAMISFSALLFLSGVSPSGLPQAFGERKSFSLPHEVIANGPLALGYVASAAALGGLVAGLGFPRCRPFVWVALAGCGPTLVAYGLSLTTPKYLHGAIPFLVLPALVGAKALTGRSGLGLALVVGVAVLHLAEGAIGVRTSAPEFRRYQPASLAFESVVGHRRTRPVLAGFGEGEILGTADGPRLRTGWLWSGSVWRRCKSSLLNEIARADQLLGVRPLPDVITSNYFGHRVLVGWLRTHGFTAQLQTPIDDAGSFRQPWRHPDGSTLTVTLINNSDHESAKVTRALVEDRPVLFLNDRGPADFAFIVGTPSVHRWIPLSPAPDWGLAWYRLAEGTASRMN